MPRKTTIGVSDLPFWGFRVLPFLQCSIHLYKCQPMGSSAEHHPVSEVSALQVQDSSGMAGPQLCYAPLVAYCHVSFLFSQIQCDDFSAFSPSAFRLFRSSLPNRPRSLGNFSVERAGKPLQLTSTALMSTFHPLSSQASTRGAYHRHFLS